MFKIKRYLSLTLLVIGVWAGAFLLTDFSVAQNYYMPTGNDLFGKLLRFVMPDSPVYWYAITEPNTYTIYFDWNWDTSWSMSGMSMVYDQKRNLLPNGFERDWYIFKWWSSSEWWEVEYLDQTGVINLTTEDWWEVVLYAQRSEAGVPYIIEYYQENVAWTWYDLVWTGIGYGNEGTGIVLTWNMYTWFTLQTWDEVSISSGWVVPYRYTRNTYNLTVMDRDDVLIVTWIKFEGDVEWVLPESLTWWTWNTFLWWNNIPEWWKMPAEDVVIRSMWSYGVHSITFDTEWWSEVEMITGNYGDLVIPPSNPTKEGYEFVRWEPELPNRMPYDDIVVKAVWREAEGNSWKWRSGRWWGWGRWSDEDIGGEGGHGAAEDGWDWIRDQEPRRWMVDLETFFAYMWAHDMWIIDTTWEESDPDGYVTRWAMAEMVVKFSEKVLGREIPERIPRECVWWDANREWKRVETKVYAEKACALWVMWIRMKNFMPNKILDRAEFGTILSRLLWWDKYDVVDATKTKLYYTRHLDALKEKKIMTEISNPEMKKELRKWAWLMLMRSRIEERLMK